MRPAQPSGDARHAEHLRRAHGLNTDLRLALLKEMFLPGPHEKRLGNDADRA